MTDVTFTRDYDYRVPGKQAIVAYRRGWSGKVPAAHAKAAGSAGALAKPGAKSGAVANADGRGADDG
ncbi:hypothetical protein [Aurantimonas sp. 22II-16-19i]|uniref:hypothetical protein n=1 Tax=Aurantimonas sp. 22II-16-19i TaxID=1317114 RepID=UPI0009F7BE83|nr:hypothetical protein [Aurantimonas sp. 22II-16-19i]ORE89745.1 hypothetical protein ATO4_23742 [Aurantimonas sp. 22II-16-19i]